MGGRPQAPRKSSTSSIISTTRRTHGFWSSPESKNESARRQHSPRSGRSSASASCHREDLLRQQASRCLGDVPARRKRISAHLVRKFLCPPRGQSPDGAGDSRPDDPFFSRSPVLGG